MVIYMTVNKVNGKKYIGKTVEDDPKYLGSGVALTKAIKKYGRKNFEKVIIEECKNENHLNLREKYWIDTFHAVESSNFYNLTYGGEGGNTTSYHPDKKNFYSNRTDRRYGPELSPPKGTIMYRFIQKYKVNFKGREFVGNIEECLNFVGCEKSVFFGYIKNPPKNPIRFADLKVKKYNEMYILIDGKKYNTHKEIQKDYNISISMISHNLRSTRKNWWRIEKII